MYPCLVDVNDSTAFLKLFSALFTLLRVWACFSDCAVFWAVSVVVAGVVVVVVFMALFFSGLLIQIDQK